MTSIIRAEGAHSARALPYCCIAVQNPQTRIHRFQRMRAPPSNDPGSADRRRATTAPAASAGSTDGTTDVPNARPGRPATSGASYTEGSVEAHVRRLTGFMIIGFLAMTLAQFIEAIYLGQVGTAELAAVAYTFPLTLGLNAMVRGVGIGASAVVARTLGSGDAQAAGRLISHCLLLVAGFAALFVLIALSWSANLFEAMGASGRVQSLATQYTHIWFVGFPMFALSMVGSGLIRSVGDAAYPGYVMTLGSLLQVVLGPFLIFGWLGLPALGIAGAGWAFVLARSISFAMTWHWLARRKQLLIFDLTGFRASSRAILHVGLPSILTNLVPSISTGIVTAMLASYGHGVVAGFGVASRVEALVSMVVIAVSASTGPMVGQNWGARRIERVHATLRICYQYCLAWGVIAGVIMLVGGHFLVGLINTDPELIVTAAAYLHIVPFSIGFMGVMAVASASFNALAKPLPPLLLSLARTLVLYVPLAWIAGRWFGYLGIFWATAIANVLTGAVAWQWNRSMLAHAERGV